MLQYKSVSGNVTDVDEPQGIVTGYFAHFGSKDSDGDIIHPGSFLKTISEKGLTGANRIKHLLNHDKGRPIGTIKELTEDSTGLRYVSQLWKGTPDADLVLIGAKYEHNFEHSIGYNENKGASQRKADANHMYELELFEGSTLTFYGANPNTHIVEVKSAYDLDRAYKLLGEELRSGRHSGKTKQFLEDNYESLAIGLASRDHKAKADLDYDDLKAAFRKGLYATSN